MNEPVPDWPYIEAETFADGTAVITIDGRAETIPAQTLEGARTAIVNRVADTAAKLGRPVRVSTVGPGGRWPLIISPTGQVDPAPQEVAPRRSAEQPAQQHPSLITTVPTHARPAQPDPADDPGQPRQSFLTKTQTEEPASRGPRGLFTRVGIRMKPSADERGERADMQAVSQHWPGPRTIAVVNGKGGANKTPTTILLSAVFARHGGAGVLAWDNNQTRGTLGWRTEQGPHDSTLLELLPETGYLLGTGAQSADLARYVHHQTRDRYDVLRSKPQKLADEQRLDGNDVDAIHAIAAKYYRLIIMDSSNDESDPMWRRMIDHADQLVVATTTRDEHAEAAALLLEDLPDRDSHAAGLARGAIVIISQADPNADRREVARIANAFASQAHEAVTVPFDQALVDGPLTYGSLHAATQRAWLHAGAAVARGLSERLLGTDRV